MDYGPMLATRPDRLPAVGALSAPGNSEPGGSRGVFRGANWGQRAATGVVYRRTGVAC